MSKRRLHCGHVEWKDGRCAEMTCPNYVNKHLDEKWPTDAQENATRALVAFADTMPELGLSAKALVNLYLSVEAILTIHDVNPRKLIDAMDHFARNDVGNE